MNLIGKTCFQLALLGMLAGGVQPAAQPSPPRPSGQAPAGPAVTPEAAPQWAPVLSSATNQPPPSAGIRGAEGDWRTLEPGVYPPAAGTRGTDIAIARQQLDELQHVLRNTSQAGRAGGSVLVVPSKQMETQNSDPLLEDLTIMSRIIHKSLADAYLLPEVSAMDALIVTLALPAQNVGPRVFFPVTRRLKPMYVGGYGALFFLQVDFPLVAPAQPAEPTGPQESDPVWSEARRTLYEPPSVVLPTRVPLVEAYSEDKVALLRSRLVEIMKHATNIRALDPNDWVTIVVRGPAPGDPEPRANVEPGLADAGPAGRTVLTLRARKPDVDLYAQGRLDPAQVEQRFQITTSKQ